MRVNDIRVNGNRRALRDVSELAASMDAVGQLQPIIVSGDGTLIAGRHRLEAARLLGWESIDAIISDLSGAGAELAEIDENLIRHDLTPAERAHYTARRKLVYLELHPETGHGKATKDRDANLATFVDATSGATGQSKRGVARDARRGERIAPDVLDAIQGTEHDKGTSLDALARMEPEEQREAIKLPHVAHNSGDNEWYTPADIIEAAREVLGVIDLDPASSEAANAKVGARAFYSKDDDGLKQPWAGAVWMNPPYAKGLIDPFCERMVSAYCSGDVTSAIVLVNNATETQWGQLLLVHSSAVCLPHGRIKYWSPDKKPSAPLQGQMLVYFGDAPQRFRDAFSAFGVVLRG